MIKSKSRLISFFAILLLSGVLVAASLSAAGVFDPPSTGSLLWQGEPDPLQIDAHSSHVLWLTDVSPAELPATVRVSTALNSGETDIGYGLMLGQKDGAVAIAVSPLGNIAVWKQNSQDPLQPVDYYLHWQTWPHVHFGSQVNEIEVNLDGGKINVRINREWLWEGNGLDRVDTIGVFGISYGDQATIDFQSAELFGT